MSNVEIHGRASPWPRRLLATWLFLTGCALGSYLTRGDARDWSLSTQWTKITTVENVTTGERSIVQEQSGSTETRANPATPNAPGVGLFGAEGGGQ